MSDVLSVRARPVGERIEYRVFDEHEFEYTCRPRSSSLALTLDELATVKFVVPA